MAEYSSFWNSEVGDVREYNASEFAEYFNRFISDGVYVKDSQMGLRVLAGSGLQITVAVGFAYIKGYLYKSDEIITKTIDAPDATLNRIDRVVLRFDEIARSIEVVIKKGGFASSPVPPVLVNTDSLKEMSLAQIRVNKGATSVTVTDEREQVALLIDVPLEDFLIEWQQFKNDNQEDFNLFIQGLENILDETTAGNLLSLIQTNETNITSNETNITLLETDITSLETDKMDKTKIHLSATDAVIGDMAEGDIWIKYI